MVATVVGVSEYIPAWFECAVPLGGGGYDGRARYCVATAFKLGFKLGDLARPTACNPLGLADDPTRAAHGVPVEGPDMKATFRLSVLVFLLVLAVLPGALRGSGSAIAGETGQLSVLDWPGYDAQAFWIDFKNKHPDVTVNFEIGSSDADIYGKIKAGSQADIVHPYTGWLQVYVNEGLVEEIDVTKVANWDKIPGA